MAGSKRGQQMGNASRMRARSRALLAVCRPRISDGAADG